MDTLCDLNGGLIPICDVELKQLIIWIKSKVFEAVKEYLTCITDTLN
jgi:hypothetical protein